MKAGLGQRRDDLRNTLVVAVGLAAATALMLRAVVGAATHAIPRELRDPPYD